MDGLSARPRLGRIRLSCRTKLIQRLRRWGAGPEEVDRNHDQKHRVAAFHGRGRHEPGDSPESSPSTVRSPFSHSAMIAAAPTRRRSRRAECWCSGEPGASRHRTAISTSPGLNPPSGPMARITLARSAKFGPACMFQAAGICKQTHGWRGFDRPREVAPAHRRIEYHQSTSP